MDLDRVFDEEYDKMYDGFDWSAVGEDFIKPEKDNLKSRILKFSWLEDWSIVKIYIKTFI